jgi:hypothetical protein
MNKLRPILLVLTAVAALSFAHPARANLITNGGFEDGGGAFFGWSTSGGVFDSGFFKHSGDHAALMSGNGAISQGVTTTPGTSYVVNFFLACNSRNGGASSINVLWGGTSIFSHLFSSSQDFTEYTFTVTASSAITALEFQSAGTTDLFLDDISVNPAGVGVPDGGSTVCLLGCALLGLTALRRKLSC